MIIVINNQDPQSVMLHRLIEEVHFSNRNFLPRFFHISEKIAREPLRL